MTNENLNPEVDPIDQAQAEVDKEQGGGDQPSYMTTEGVSQMLLAQGRVYERQIAGLTSKIDTGLNAIRRDTNASMQQQLAQASAQGQTASYLASLDEDQRALVQPLVNQIQGLQEQIQGQTQQPQGDTQPSQTASPAGGWDTVYTVVRQLGLDPQTKGIDYDALTEPGLTSEQRQERFLTSVQRTIVATAAAQTQSRTNPPQNEAAQQAQPVVNPPVDGPPRTSATYRNIDDVRDAFVTDKIPELEAKRLAASMGQQL